MADRVRYNMDQMVGFFRKLEESQLFKPEEVKAIIKKRTDYEYVLMRRELSKQDVTNYLKYELTLDKLRELRVQKVKAAARSLDNPEGLTRQQIVMFNRVRIGFVKHIHYIYYRVVRRFASHLPFWYDYIKFLQTKKSNSLLDATLGKAIAMHPRESKFWIFAATHELQVNKNFHAARVIMQRALRVNEKCPELWKHSFQLELWNLLRAIERQKLLMNKNALTDKKEKMLMEVEVEEELFAPVLVVFKYAILALKDSNNLADIFHMHTSSIGVCDQLSELLDEQLKAIIFQNNNNNSQLQSIYWKHNLVVKLKAYVLTSNVIQLESESIVNWEHEQLATFVINGWKNIQHTIEEMKNSNSGIDKNAFVEVYDAGIQKLLELLHGLFKYHEQVQDRINNPVEEIDEHENDNDDEDDEEDEKEQAGKAKKPKQDEFVVKVNLLLDIVNEVFVQNTHIWNESSIDSFTALKNYISTLTNTTAVATQELFPLIKTMIELFGAEAHLENSTTKKSTAKKGKGSETATSTSFDFTACTIISYEQYRLIYHTKCLLSILNGDNADKSLSALVEGLNTIDTVFVKNLVEDINELIKIQQAIEIRTKTVADITIFEHKLIEKVSLSLMMYFQTKEFENNSAKTDIDVSIRAGIKKVATLLSKSKYGNQFLLNDIDCHDSSHDGQQESIHYSLLNDDEYIQMYWGILKDMQMVESPILRLKYIEKMFEIQFADNEDNFIVDGKEGNAVTQLQSEFNLLKDTFDKVYGIIKSYPMSYAGMDKSKFFHMVYDIFQRAQNKLEELYQNELESSKKRKSTSDVNECRNEMRDFQKSFLEKAIEDDTSATSTEENSHFYDHLLKLHREDGKIEIANHLQYKRRRLLEL